MLDEIVREVPAPAFAELRKFPIRRVVGVPSLLPERIFQFDRTIPSVMGEFRRVPDLIRHGDSVAIRIVGGCLRVIAWFDCAEEMVLFIIQSTPRNRIAPPSGGLDPRPIPVGYKEFPITMLPACGGAKRSSSAPNSSLL